MSRRVVVADLGTGTERNLTPLAIGLIVSAAKARPQLNAAFEIEAHYLDRDVDCFLARRPDLELLALSCYVWNISSSLRFAAEVKRRRPEVAIVLGGPSVPIHPERISDFLALKPWVDVLVHHEGELTFAHLLETIASGGDLAQVEGITFRAPETEHGCVTNPLRGRIQDLDAIPSPYLNGLFDDVLERYGDRLTGALVETNRGCPYSCTFCEWGMEYKNQVRRFDASRVEAELDWVARRGISYLFAADANFGIFFDRDLAFARRIGELRHRHGAPTFFFVNWLKNSHQRLLEIADVLVDSGVSTLTTMALQSTHEETLRLIRRKNLDLARRTEIRAAFHRRERITYTELILGLPGESLESFRRGVLQATSPNGNDWLAIYLCQLVEVSEMSSPQSRRRNGFETRHCQQGVHLHSIRQENEGETVEVVVATSTLTTSEWKRSFLFGYLVSALYFYRLAFFVLNYLRDRSGVELEAFFDFLLARTEDAPDRFPAISGGVGVLARHADGILDNGHYLATVEGFGDTAFLPQEAAAVYLLDRLPEFLGELAALVAGYAEAHDLRLDRAELEAVLRYQRLRLPATRQAARAIERFDFDVHSYFEALSAGASRAPFERRAIALRTRIPEDLPPPGLARIISRMRTSMALVPWDVETVEPPGGMTLGRALPEGARQAV